MNQQRRTCRHWVCVALSAVLVAACSGGEPAPVGQQVLCVHPDRDALARLAAGELNPSLLEEDVVSTVLRGEAAQAQIANEPTAAAGAPLAVEFSAPPGFHAADVPLELNASDRTAAIFYTLDGSTPNPDAAGQIGCAPPLGDFRGRTYRYVGPIDLAWWLERPNNLSVVNTSVRTERLAWSEPRQRVAKAAVVRAVATRGRHSSPPVTGTFFIDSLGRDRYSLPVVSLSTDPSNLFDEQVGIYVPGQDPDDPNYAQRGDAWERVAHLELFDQRGQRPVSQDVGIRVHGNFTRSFPQKSLRLYARKEYGSSRLRHQFFETKATTDFKRLILRNGGNDWGGTMFRDAAMQSLVQHLPLETQHAQPSVVFINGEYWGLHLFRDRLDEFHFETTHGIPREQVTILDNDAVLKSGSTADVAAYQALLDQLEDGSLNDPEAIDAHIALPELLDYVALQIYAGNTDWPHNNIATYRYSGPSPSGERGPRDGRWRMLPFDLDRSLGRVQSLDADIIAHLFADREGHWSRRLFQSIILIEPIRHEFIQRLAVHLATTFAPERVDAVIAHFTRAIEAEMPAHIERWNAPTSMDAFYSGVETSHEFARRRPRTVRKHAVSFFKEVDGLATVRIHHIHPERAPTLHGVRLTPDTPGVTVKDGVWEGLVFAGVPLRMRSGGDDLSQATIEGKAAVASTSDELELELVLEPEAQVDVYLPAVG